MVASFTDAWIETRLRAFKIRALEVASFTDAWIETAVWRADVPSILSHLLQMRGLKPPAVGDGMISATSHLLQMRGLKHLKS